MLTRDEMKAIRTLEIKTVRRLTPDGAVWFATMKSINSVSCYNKTRAAARRELTERLIMMLLAENEAMRATTDDAKAESALSIMALRRHHEINEEMTRVAKDWLIATGSLRAVSR